MLNGSLNPAPPLQKSVPHNRNLQALSQATIGKWIDLIPQIFNDCIALEGVMAGH